MMGEAAEFEEALARGAYDEPPDIDRSYGMPKRRRCIVCDTLDWHPFYVRLETPHGRYVESLPVCERDRPTVGSVVVVKAAAVKRYRRHPDVQAAIAERRAG